MTLQHHAIPESDAPETKVIRNLSVKFALPLHYRFISSWRGAVAQSAGHENNFFHNHTTRDTPDRYERRYPLIQYRVADGKAAIWALQEGVEAIQDWLAGDLRNFRMGKRNLPLRTTDFAIRRTRLQITPSSDTSSPRTYRLLDYLPFHAENYRRWLALDCFTDRVTLLEEIITGHLLGFCTAVGYRLPTRLEVRILLIKNIRTERVHGGERMAFNLLFRCNLQLPPGMALGRSVAFGFGVLHGVRKR